MKEKPFRMEDEKMKDLFLNPTKEYRAKPFWAWNGQLREEELKRQMDALKQMGFGGTFMHSRVGLETEYLVQNGFISSMPVLTTAKRLEWKTGSTMKTGGPPVLPAVW